VNITGALAAEVQISLSVTARTREQVFFRYRLKLKRKGMFGGAGVNIPEISPIAMEHTGHSDELSRSKCGVNCNKLNRQQPIFYQC
jgi:hypothetical protein